jgi:hypothetical protein
MIVDQQTNVSALIHVCHLVVILLCALDDAAKFVDERPAYQSGTQSEIAAAADFGLISREAELGQSYTDPAAQRESGAFSTYTTVSQHPQDSPGRQN